MLSHKLFVQNDSTPQQPINNKGGVMNPFLNFNLLGSKKRGQIQSPFVFGTLIWHERRNERSSPTTQCMTSYKLFSHSKPVGLRGNKLF